MDAGNRAHLGVNGQQEPVLDRIHLLSSTGRCPTTRHAGVHTDSAEEPFFDLAPLATEHSPFLNPTSLLHELILYDQQASS